MTQKMIQNEVDFSKVEIKSFKPSLRQQLAWWYLHDSVTTEIGYGGAANGGKSWLISMFMISCGSKTNDFSRWIQNHTSYC